MSIILTYFLLYKIIIFFVHYFYKDIMAILKKKFKEKNDGLIMVLGLFIDDLDKKIEKAAEQVD